MKYTGITRNIDEVGRLVIPREIRKSLKLNQGTPMEIFIDENQNLVLKKTAALLGFDKRAKEIAKIFNECFDMDILISDLEKVVAYVGNNKKDYIEKDISNELANKIQNRVKAYFSKNQLILVKDIISSNFALAPIIIDSNCCGSIIIFNSTSYTYNEKTLIKLSVFISKILSQ